MVEVSQKKALRKILNCFSQAGTIYSDLCRTEYGKKNIVAINGKMKQILDEYSSVLHSKCNYDTAMKNAKLYLKEMGDYLIQSNMSFTPA